jgi:hypothetical protein
VDSRWTLAAPFPTGAAKKREKIISEASIVRQTEGATGRPRFIGWAAGNGGEEENMSEPDNRISRFGTPIGGTPFSLYR